MKKKNLFVEDLRSINTRIDASFRVKKVVNSITFKIDQLLSEEKVSAYCNHPEWTVYIIEKK